MRFDEWLEVTDDVFCVVYIEDDSDSVWEGFSFFVPWWLGKMYLQDDPDILNGEKPIAFRNDLGEDYDHRPGFIVNLTGREVE